MNKVFELALSVDSVKPPEDVTRPLNMLSEKFGESKNGFSCSKTKSALRQGK